jgi:rhodanese-related sulfurtransferase
MLKFRSICVTAVTLGAFFFLGCLLNTGIKSPSVFAAPVEPTPGRGQGESTAASSIPAAELISTQDLAQTLQSAKGEKPLLIYVGFRIPYAEAHIPGSEFFGPAAKPASVQELRKHVEGLPRNRFIVIYCGCCPWNHCPNVKPAYQALRDLGFTKLKVLYIPDNLGTDWVDKGYPAEKGK